MAIPVPQGFYRLLSRIEHMAAIAQGKGYGTGTVQQEVNLLQKLLGAPAQLAIDIGGNVGNYTVELRLNNPALEIHIFEPSKINISKLEDRFRLDDLVTIVPVALSDVSGSATLFSNMPGSGLASLTKRKLEHFNIRFDETEIINTICFEEYWISALQSRQLDMVKIDIEGHELGALKGFGEALKNTKVLQFEFGGCNIDTKTYFQDYWYFFREHLFDIYRISPFGPVKIIKYSEIDEFFSTTNYIAVNRR